METTANDPVVLLHGWPHTSQVWREIVPTLARDHLVLTPDLRGFTQGPHPTDGYDLNTLVDDVLDLLDNRGLPTAKIVGIDLGAPIAFMCALREPARFTRLVVMEALIGTLPGAEAFPKPWWFGFHAVPQLAETVLAGHEREYIEWFLRAGMRGRTLPADLRDAFTGTGDLRGGLEHYRAMKDNAALIEDLVKQRRLTVPTAAIGGAVVGEATYRQLQPFTDTLEGHLIPDGGHILPLDRPQELLAILTPFLRRSTTRS